MSAGIEFVDRIEKLRLPNENDSAFARRMGVSLTTLRDWKLLCDANRDFDPKVKTVRRVAGNLGVPLEWLLLGLGSPTGSDHQVTQQSGSPNV